MYASLVSDVNHVLVKSFEEHSRLNLNLMPRLNHGAYLSSEPFYDTAQVVPSSRIEAHNTVLKSEYNLIKLNQSCDTLNYNCDFKGVRGRSKLSLKVAEDIIPELGFL